MDVDAIRTAGTLPRYEHVPQWSKLDLSRRPRAFRVKAGVEHPSGALVQALAGEKGVTLVSATDHDSRAFTVALKKAMGSRGLTPAFHVEFDPGKNAAEAATRAKGAPAVALVAGPADSVRFLRALRASGFGGRIYAAAYAYDATNLVLDAIRELFPYTGASGEIRFDALGRNSHPVRLATVRGGRVITWTQSAAR